MYPLVEKDEYSVFIPAEEKDGSHTNMQQRFRVERFCMLPK